MYWRKQYKMWLLSFLQIYTYVALRLWLLKLKNPKTTYPLCLNPIIL